MRLQGKIADWNDAKGFGFVTPNGGGTRAFVHIKAFTRRGRRPVDGDVITYEETLDSKDRPQATDVRYPKRAGRKIYKRESSSSNYPIALGFFVLLVALVWKNRIPLELLFFYFVASIVAFIAYALDKSHAKRQRWRIQEDTLHLWGVIGGWPGALIAQKIFRHKSRKRAFQMLFWITVLVNCAGLFWLMSNSGMKFLGSL